MQKKLTGTGAGCSQAKSSYVAAHYMYSSKKHVYSFTIFRPSIQKHFIKKYDALHQNNLLQLPIRKKQSTMKRNQLPIKTILLSTPLKE